MMRRVLIVATSILGLVGVTLVLVPFSSSMHPSERAKAARSQHDISNLSTGEFIFERFGRESAWEEKVLIIRDWDNSIYAYLVPTELDQVAIPDRFWGFAVYLCSDFRPELDSNQKIKVSGVITCHDREAPGGGQGVLAMGLHRESKISLAC